VSKRWPLRVAYAVGLLVQAGLLAGAYELHTLSRRKMMVMRYLVARNLELEAFWFSPAALLAQTTAFVAIAVALLVCAYVLLRRARRAACVHALIGAALAGFGASLSATLSASDVRALYVILAAVWITLALQAVVVAASAFAAARAERGRTTT